MLIALLALSVCAGWIRLFANGFAGMRFELPQTGQQAAFAGGIFVVMFVFFGLQQTAVFAAALIAQEAGHAIAARSFGHHQVQPRLAPFFARSNTWSVVGISGTAAAIVALSGPATLAILSLSALAAFGQVALVNFQLGSMLILFSVIAAALGLLSLIPVPPFSGGRIVSLMAPRIAKIVGVVTIIGFVLIASSQSSILAFAIPIIGILGLGRSLENEPAPSTAPNADKMLILSAFGIFAYILWMCARPALAAL